MRATREYIESFKAAYRWWLDRSAEEQRSYYEALLRMSQQLPELEPYYFLLEQHQSAFHEASSQPPRQPQQPRQVKQPPQQRDVASSLEDLLSSLMEPVGDGACDTESLKPPEAEEPSGDKVLVGLLTTVQDDDKTGLASLIAKMQGTRKADEPDEPDEPAPAAEDTSDEDPSEATFASLLASMQGDGDSALVAKVCGEVDKASNDGDKALADGDEALAAKVRGEIHTAIANVFVAAPEAEDHACKAPDGVTDEMTTVIIKNVPPTSTRDDLLAWLGGFCILDSIDYAYAPRHFTKNVSLGYAILNFNSSQNAAQFMADVHGRRFFYGKPGSEVTTTLAHTQGLEANLRLYARRGFRTRNTSSVPVVYTALHPMGKLLLKLDDARAVCAELGLNFG